jgi:arabinose-5-phosphate isomerase
MNLGRQIIQKYIAALTQLMDTFPIAFPQAIQSLRDVSGKIICSGVGKSAAVARKVASTLSSTGHGSFFVHPTEALHGDLGVVSPCDALLVFSNSGETTELLRFVQHSSARLRILVTSRAQSSLAFCCDTVLVIPACGEACPFNLAPTTSTLLMLALGDALALTLSSLKNFTQEHYGRLHPSGSLGLRFSRVDQVMRKPAPLVRADATPVQMIQAIIAGGAECVGILDARDVLCGMIDGRDVEALLSLGQVTHRKPLILDRTMPLFQAIEDLRQQDQTRAFVRNESGAILGLFCLEDGLKGGKAGD